MNAWRRVWGPTRFVIPARRAMLRTIRAAAWRSSRPSSLPQKIRTFAAFTDGEIKGPGGPGCECDRDDLAALAEYPQSPVTAFETEPLDVRAGRFRYAQAVQSEERDECVVAGVAEPGRDEHGPDLVAIEARRVGLVVEAWSSDMHRR